MSGESFVCALDGCEVEGVKTTHNQKYCSAEHCKIATNAKIMVEYYKNAAIRNGQKRLCAECGETPLSRYNPSDICSGCDSKARRENRKNMDDLAFLVS